MRVGKDNKYTDGATLHNIERAKFLLRIKIIHCLFNPILGEEGQIRSLSCFFAITLKLLNNFVSNFLTLCGIHF